MKITKSQLKQIIKEELKVTFNEGFLDRFKKTPDPEPRDIAAEIPPEDRAQYYRDKEPTEKEAAFTQHVADFEHIVAAISRAYGDERVEDVATELVRMIAGAGGLNTDTLAWPKPE